jgi:hypothetical protein
VVFPRLSRTCCRSLEQVLQGHGALAFRDPQHAQRPPSRQAAEDPWQRGPRPKGRLRVHGFEDDGAPIAHPGDVHRGNVSPGQQARVTMGRSEGVVAKALAAWVKTADER